MLDSLFRQEVIDAYYERWLGEPRLGRSLSSWLFLLLGVAAILSLSLLVLVGTYARHVVISGVIVPQVEPFNVVSPVSGRIVGVSLHKSDVVRAWQPLFVIVPEEARLPEGSRSRSSLALRRPRLNTKHVVQCLESGRGGEPAAGPDDDAPGTCFQQSPRSLIVVSTIEGRAVDVVASSGQAVTRGQIMGRILPSNTQLVAREFVSPDQLSTIHEGQDVLLRLRSANELPPISGKIASIVPAFAPYSGSLSLETRQATTYAVDIGIPRTVDVSGKEPLILAAGMQFSSSLLVEKRPIYRWMFPSLKRTSH